MNNLQLNLFESTNANFRLAVQGMFVKKNIQTNNDTPLVKVYNSGTVIASPNVFLVFTYMTESFETSKSVYTSNPHLFKIRKALRFLADAIDNNAFINNNGTLIVDDRYAEPQVIANIGKKNSFISFRLVSDGLVDASNNAIPSVEVALSDAPNVSILTIDEFYAIYEIVEKVNLPEMAMILSTAQIQQLSAPAPRPQQTQQGYTRQQPQQTQRVWQPQQTAQPQSQSYASGGFRPQAAAPRQTQQMAPATTVDPTEQMARAEVNPYSFQAPKSNTMAPRSNAGGTSLMGNADIESIPTEELDLGDEGLSDLFAKGN